MRRTSSRRKDSTKMVVEKAADMMEVDEEFEKENIENEEAEDDVEESDSASDDGEAFDIKVSPAKVAPKRVGRAKKIAFDSSSSSGQIIYGSN